MHNVNITNILAIYITTYHLAGANYTHMLSRALYLWQWMKQDLLA